MVIDPWGRVLYQGSPDAEEEGAFVSFDPAAVERIRADLKVFCHAVPGTILISRFFSNQARTFWSEEPFMVSRVEAEVLAGSGREPRHFPKNYF